MTWNLNRGIPIEGGHLRCVEGCLLGSGSNKIACLGPLGFVILIEPIKPHYAPDIHNGALPSVHVSSPSQPTCIFSRNSFYSLNFASRNQKYAPFFWGGLLGDFAREDFSGPLHAARFVSFFCACFRNLSPQSSLNSSDRIIGEDLAVYNIAPTEHGMSASDFGACRRADPPAPEAKSAAARRCFSVFFKSIRSFCPAHKLFQRKIGRVLQQLKDWRYDNY